MIEILLSGLWGGLWGRAAGGGTKPLDVNFLSEAMFAFPFAVGIGLSCELLGFSEWFTIPLATLVIMGLKLTGLADGFQMGVGVPVIRQNALTYVVQLFFKPDQRGEYAYDFLFMTLRGALIPALPAAFYLACGADPLNVSLFFLISTFIQPASYTFGRAVRMLNWSLQIDWRDPWHKNAKHEFDVGHVAKKDFNWWGEIISGVVPTMLNAWIIMGTFA